MPSRSSQIARLCWAALLTSACTPGPSKAAAPCDDALARGAVCEAANVRALEIISADHLEAVIVIQDVRSGGLVAFAASDPAKLDVTTPLPPLSPVKLLAAASALDQPDMKIRGWPESEKLLDDSIVSGNDDAGRRIASDLRTTAGTDKVLQDLERYGFPPRQNHAKKLDHSFWAELAPRWQNRLIPASVYHSLGQAIPSKEWNDTLSIGEERFIVTALHISRFLQAVGHGGVMMPAVARAEESEGEPGPQVQTSAKRIMSEPAASQLQTVMKATVERGTAKSAKAILAGTGWTMGGKTGTGPDPITKAPGPGSNGCFVGLIFDPAGKARFTVVTFVNRGGPGGGNAAQISAKVARFVTGAP